MAQTPDMKITIAKQLKDVIEALGGVTTLENDLQQQLGKSEGSKREEIADDLASAIHARTTLIDTRRALLKQLKS